MTRLKFVEPPTSTTHFVECIFIFGLRKYWLVAAQMLKGLRDEHDQLT